MRKGRGRWLSVAACVVACAGVVGGCGPGDSADQNAKKSGTGGKVDLASLGDITLTVWDQQTVTAQRTTAEALNQQFQAKYPNIKIKRVAREFNDLKTRLKLALSSDDAPDVVQVNQGYGDVGAYAKAGYLRPLDDYAKTYGWTERYKPELLNQNRATKDGRWGEGDLYGVSTTAEMVGLYYNADQLEELGLEPPKTWSEFNDAMAKAKDAGKLPLQYGSSDKGPAIHEFGTVLTGTAGAKEGSNLVFGRDDASWSSPDVVKAFQTLEDWSKKGYIPSSANGFDGARMAANFAKGDGVFMVSGTWWGADMAKHPEIGFTALTPEGGSSDAAMGGFGLMWAVTSKAENADAAAAYVDFITNAQSADTIVKSGDLPANGDGSAKAEEGTIGADLTTSLQSVLESGGLVPYLDYTAPGFFDVIVAQVQQVTAGKTSPEDAAGALQQSVESASLAN